MRTQYIYSSDWQSEQRIRYSDPLRAGQLGVQTSVGARDFFSSVHPGRPAPGPSVQQVSWPFPGGKAAGA